jgi:ParB-like chromosome segregation protein Spo0J
MKKTVTMLDRKQRIRLFRLPQSGSVAHRQIGNGVTVLGDGDVVRLPSDLKAAEPSCRFADGRALGAVKVAAAEPWLLQCGAGSAPRVIAERDIKIADVVVNPHHRSINPAKLEEIKDSIATLKQRIRITVSPRKDGKFDLIDGNHRLEAKKALGSNVIRAEIIKGSEVDLQLVEIAGNKQRAPLTALEEAEKLAKWVRGAKDRQPIYRSFGQTKRGRPEGAVAKAAREVGKGTTEAARRKEIERAMKIDAIAPKAKAALVEAGLADKQTVLLKVAGMATPKAQLANVEQLKSPKPPGSSGSAKNKSGRLKLPQQSTQSLSPKQERTLENLLEMWHDADEIREALAKAPLIVRERFTEQILELAGEETDLKEQGEDGQESDEDESVKSSNQDDDEEDDSTNDGEDKNDWE